MKKKIEWIIYMGDGNPLWQNGLGEPEGCATRGEARDYVRSIKRDIFQPWYKNVILPLKILRREWAIVDEREVR